ncbi:DUF3006 family protein [Proteocatella sphenisci]|uniref:DUF3006 family protein n=1 Tax=Proteocatella sphenisci TaxID=181070 RepID=UPI00049085C2|nr:DUF3006 family protein [Proteocatella sphenisci]
MIKGTIDRFEGQYALVEIAYEEIFFIDILSENFTVLPSEGDIIIIESIKGISVSDEYGFVSDEVKKILCMLENPVETLILIDKDQTEERKSRIEKLASELFED